MTLLPAMPNAVPAWTLMRSREEFGRPDLPLLTVVSAKGVAVRDLAEGRAPSEDLSNYRVVAPGDLVVNKLWARFGAYGVSPCAGIISPAYWVLDVDRNRVCPPYLHHLLRSPAYLAEIGRISRNLPPNGYDLSWEQFRSMPVCLPSPEEQRRIADFLDDQVAVLDRAAALRRRQTALLETAEAGLLHTTLEENEGWPQVPIKHLVSLLTSGPRGWGDYVTDGGTPFIRIANVPARGVGLRLDNLYRVTAPPGPERERSRTRKGDVLVTITAELGAVAVVPEAAADGNVSQHVALLRPRSGLIDSDYLAWAIKAPKAHTSLTSSGYGGTKVGLGLADVGNLRVALPPLAEQLQAVASSGVA